jgi:hypothetical protein
VAARAGLSTSSLKAWLLTHPYTLAGVVVAAVLAVPFLTRTQSEWEEVYVAAAQHLRDGLDIYEPKLANAYPPFATLAALPFTWLSPVTRTWVWLAVNLASLVFLLRGSWQLAGGGRLEGGERAPFREHVAAILGGLCGVFYLQNALAHHQTDIVLGALLIGGCLALARERALLGATCFGLAAAMKCTPLLWAPYLIWRRRPGAAAWLVAVALGVNLLPNLVQQPAADTLWLTEYANRYLKPISASDSYLGTWPSDLVYNQSLAGAGQRWLVTTWEWTPTDCLVMRRPHALTPQIVNAVILGIEMALVLLTLAICRRPFQRLIGTDNSPSRRNVLEYCIVFLLMLLFSPMSSKAHFGILVLPGFCLARAAVSKKHPWTWPLLVASVILALVFNKGPLGEGAYTLTLWLGCVTWQTLLLLAGCLGLLAFDKTSAPVQNASADNETPRLAA